MSDISEMNGSELDIQDLLKNTHLSNSTRLGVPMSPHIQAENLGTAQTNGSFPAYRPHSNMTEATEDDLAFLVVHKVTCDGRRVAGEDHQDHPQSASFLDHPRLFAGDTRASALRGQKPFYYEEDLFPDICMIVYRLYDCKAYHQRTRDAFEITTPNVHKNVLNRVRPYFSTLNTTGPTATKASENIAFTSESLSQAMSLATGLFDMSLEDWNSDDRLRMPYDYFYEFRRNLRVKSSFELDGKEQFELDTLLDYIDDTYGDYFDSVDGTFAAGYVERSIFPKLFRNEDLIVTTEEGHPRAYTVERIAMSNPLTFRLGCRTWTFDGSFRRQNSTLTVQWPAKGLERIPITNLTAWPLRLDKSNLQKRLTHRGKEFWSCRLRRFVSYSAPTKGIFELQATNPKFMIDMNTYRQMHPSKFAQPLVSEDEMRELGIDLQKDEPPVGDFLCLLPPTIFGYGFHDKKWRSLSIAHIDRVSWNKDAFDRLVLKSKKKELIKALISVHLTNRQTADVIEDKGNGLIILLHGSPGTGKTLTAESVAEIAEKPLYRVTCGDIGTDAESVEKYLASVLLIGTIWECVVLLDEADVFLEERQVSDLKRNALVSVFLRILEYYDGILILTSNRVGTFDEAFKSRVQLAVHYPALDEDGRFEIWGNFIRTLQEKKVGINFNQLNGKVGVLARHKLNGRQIRNLMWTAGQLAKHKKETLDYSHLEQVIEIANEFEVYLENTHGHTDEENAQAQGTRIS